jgi:hypothetical protein
MKTITKEAVIGTLIILIGLSDGDRASASLTAVRGSSPVLLSATGEDVMSNIPQANPEGMPELFSPAFLCVFLSIMLVVGIINIIAMWKVFTKAGEPGWAVLIPIYNTYVLARVGGKPEWMGILAALGGFIPFAGPIVVWVLFIIISIGVARTFGKGVMFGLGLCFLSFIFYPILGFGSSEATGSEPKAKDYPGGGLRVPGQQFYTPAPVPSADLSPIPMPEEPVMPKEPQYQADMEPAGGIYLGEDVIHFRCSCGKGFKVPRKFAGKMGTCPQCKKRIKIPER